MVMFLGKTTEYWLELERQADTLNVPHLIREVASLRSKISFYESRIQDLSTFMKLKLEIRE